MMTQPVIIKMKSKISLFLFFVFLGLYPWYMEVPRLVVKSELQLPSYATSTAMPDLSCVCDCSSWQCQILSPLSEARDRTCIFMVTSQVTAKPQRNSHTLQFLLAFRTRNRVKASHCLKNPLLTCQEGKGNILGRMMTTAGLKQCQDTGHRLLWNILY